ncbi:hypothetical protein [Actinomadura madurae]|uniref:hypothetical protein n=1 Tax=Actinomadura madurae TaxID=1993 RepID=UPI0020D202C6|nr:hypothetical protein [Actinomadura madurae]MCQ0010677.1 hypothetical protein [Actinomadura madurae]
MEDHLPDEDVLTIPDSWRRSLHARRGGAPGPTTKVDAAAPDAVRDLIAQEGDRIGALREGGAGDPALTGPRGGTWTGRPIRTGPRWSRPSSRCAPGGSGHRAVTRCIARSSTPGSSSTASRSRRARWSS